MKKIIKWFKKRKSKKITGLEIILTIIASISFLFFALPFFHNWANNFVIKLHFCNHIACVIYSLIWLAFAIVGVYFLFKEKKMGNIWFLPYFLVFVVGILLMNMTYCDIDGNMHFGRDIVSASAEYYPKVYVDTSTDVIGIYPVPVPPCRESDSGRDYLFEGYIVSTVPLVEDACVNDVILRERYCVEGDIYHYSSEDVSCVELYGIDYGCISGRCAPCGSVETNCIDGIDNDGDGLTDCEDSDCAEHPFCASADDCIAWAGAGGYSGLSHGITSHEDCIAGATTVCGGTPFSVSWNPDIYCCAWNCESGGGDTETNCGDGIDNDGDGLIDCADPDCATDPLCGGRGIETNCGDGIDNDGDGLIDCADPDCATSPDCTGGGIETNCGDGIDNDGDGLIDCFDPDCADACGMFDYSCTHISSYPTCGGTCPPGESCITYATGSGGWCECMPDGNVPCGESSPYCSGWCMDGDVCVSNGGCYCEYYYPICSDDIDGGDYPLIYGVCTDDYGNHPDYCDNYGNLIEYYCPAKTYGGEGCIYHEYDCTAQFGEGYYCVAGACMLIE